MVDKQQMVGDSNSLGKSQTTARLVDISVLIPTIGQSHLKGCLNSIASADAWPAKLILVHQGHNTEVSGWVEELRAKGMAAQYIQSDERGTAAATNRGLECVETPFVAVTHDDCRVAADWLGVIVDHLHQHPERIVTGMVRPEDNRIVPSVITASEPAVYRRPLIDRDPLFPANMGFSLETAQQLGPFEENPLLRLAEDAEWSYRALSAGVEIAYAPKAVVEHVAWRDSTQRAETYRGYVRSLGGFYGIYLRRGDRFILLRLIYDLLRGPWILLRALVAGNRELKIIGLAYVGQLLPATLAGFRRGERP
jgi:GT2 family glycosyltransferase